MEGFLVSLVLNSFSSEPIIHDILLLIFCPVFRMVIEIFACLIEKVLLKMMPNNLADNWHSSFQVCLTLAAAYIPWARWASQISLISSSEFLLSFPSICHRTGVDWMYHDTAKWVKFKISFLILLDSPWLPRVIPQNVVMWASSACRWLWFQWHSEVWAIESSVEYGKSHFLIIREPAKCRGLMARLQKM